MSEAVTRLNAALSGRYRIERELGEGGMATVYLADDLKHERKVALKVLKPELAAVVGADRFLAEIKTTANLQHPHILPLFDSGEADGFLFYVMPFVEGETLRDRLDREHQLPVDEAVQIAKNVAEALDYAHKRGVIHRDIKPANILLQSGKPVVSDFGIALAVGAAGGGRLTETGLSLGTPHYMSPEQATGDVHVGPATDVYALGCVLYEMLVGEPPYTGSTPQAILGKIITEPPPEVTRARKTVPANVEAAIARALEKVPADRFTGAAGFAKALGDPAFRHGTLTGPRTGFRASHGLWNPLSTVLAVSTVILAGALLWSSAPPEPTQQVRRFEPGFRRGQEPTGLFDLTPDGSSLVYVGPSDDGLGTQLWIRHWDELDARPILTAEDSDIALLRSPSISPDGREVAYFVGGVLKVSPTEGGLTRTLARGLGMPYWGEDGWVYFTGGASGWSLGRIRATGGDREAVTELAENEQTHTWAELLPGGRTLLFTVSGDGLQSGAENEIWSVDLETGQRMYLASGMHARYAPTGHLIFGNADGQLLAAPFDVDRVALTGPGVPVADGLDRLARQHAYALSKEGDLVYRTGGSGEARELVWVARDESIRAVADDAVLRWAAGGTGIDGMSLSPDGTRMAYVDFVGGRKDLWSRALPDGAPVRLTFDEASEQSPTWSPDGESIVFARNETIQPNDWTLWTVPASGAGQPELLYHGGADGVWSPDGARLVIRLIGGGDIGPRGLQILRPGIDTVAVPLAANAGSTGPAVSPDGRWLAYASNETGRDEVYVRPFPNVASGKWQVSTEGGVQPVWAHSGRELFFLNPSTAELSTVEVRADGEVFRPGPVTTLFRSPLRPTGNSFAWGRDYGVAANDQEFLMTRLAPDGGSQIVLVQNFFDELKRLVPN